MQGSLVVAVGKFVIAIDVAQVAAQGGSNMDVLVECRVDHPIKGVHVIGQHNDDVTELATCASGAACLASASKDGTVSLDNRFSRRCSWMSSHCLITSAIQPGILESVFARAA